MTTSIMIDVPPTAPRPFSAVLKYAVEKVLRERKIDTSLEVGTLSVYGETTNDGWVLKLSCYRLKQAGSYGKDGFYPGRYAQTRIPGHLGRLHISELGDAVLHEVEYLIRKCFPPPRPKAWRLFGRLR